MKQLVISIAQDYFAWIAVGAGFGMGGFMLFKEKSTGKALGWFIGCLIFAFICFKPELVLTKVVDFMTWAVDKVKI
ncbi:hypothetical protein EA438_05715 [Streptococcus dysgalactiae subsp. dysgalactiae]|nr:hypothetical protein [Streptococcus dysgalactiae subsp. dysgalactiae]